VVPAAFAKPSAASKIRFGRLELAQPRPHVHQHGVCEARKRDVRTGRVLPAHVEGEVLDSFAITEPFDTRQHHQRGNDLRRYRALAFDASSRMVASEGQVRNLDLGRDSWRDFHHRNGLAWYATFRPLIASCHPHRINPQLYLEEVLRCSAWVRDAAASALSDQRRAALSPELIETIRSPWDTSAASATRCTDVHDAPAVSPS
jgi:hypothetical protein